MGFFRVEMGLNLMNIEAHVAWVTPRTFSVYDPTTLTYQNRHYQDPSTTMNVLRHRLEQDIFA
jgi:hypothetical protein